MMEKIKSNVFFLVPTIKNQDTAIFYNLKCTQNWKILFYCSVFSIASKNEYLKVPICANINEIFPERSMIHKLLLPIPIISEQFSPLRDETVLKVILE